VACLSGGQKRGGKTCPKRRRFLPIMGSQPRRMAKRSSWQERGTRPWCACRSMRRRGAQQGTGLSSRPGFHTDNLRWGSDGFLYAAGQRDTVPNLFACAPNTTQRCTSPFSVVRIDPVTLQSREVVRHPGGPTFGAASTALRIGDEYWFGTPHGDRIAIAPAN
jgi:hypothetical protein